MVNKGYSSQTAMYESAMRIRRHHDQLCYIFYLGDHDPSGEDMVRDITDRMHMFGAGVTVKKVALTMDQIHQYNPPPNPAKLTDPRAAAYIHRHGDESWEVDALPPNVLAPLIRQAIGNIIDWDAHHEVEEQEERERTTLVAALKNVKVS
jgi:hypothetical protein